MNSPKETMALWQIWGVNVLEIYGQTETAGAIITGQRGPFPRPGDVGPPPPSVEIKWNTWLSFSGSDVGPPPPSVEIKLGAENEILVNTLDLFSGYWNNPEATQSVMDEEGWLHTGDAGEWNDGKLKIIDRVRDFIVTDGGKTISPSYVENIIRASPYIAEIIVFGHARKYLTALIEIDFDTVADWARERGVVYTGFTSLAQHSEVMELLRVEIDTANSKMARVEQIKQFRILPKALDPEEEGEPVTPTRKVKRKQMYERFRDLVESMYDSQEEKLLMKSTAGVT